MKKAPTSTFDTQLTLDTPTDADIPERTHTEADWPAEAQRQHVSTADGALYHDMRANFLLTGGVVNDGKVIQSAMAHVDVDAIAARYGHMTSRQAEQRSDQRVQNLRRAAIQRDIALARCLYPLHLRAAQRRAYEPEPEPEETDSTASRAPFTPAATSEDDETEDEGDGLRRPVRLKPKPAERSEANQCWTHAHEPEPEPEETDITTNRAPFTPAATSEDDETEDEGDGLRRPVRLKPKPAERSEANRRAATHAAVQRQTTLAAFMPAHAARADALARADRLAANQKRATTRAKKAAAAATAAMSQRRLSQYFCAPAADRRPGRDVGDDCVNGDSTGGHVRELHEPTTVDSGTHSMRRQLALANQAWTLHNDDLEVRTSRCGTGNGLYARRRLRRGFRVYYYGKFYADAAHLQRDHPDDHPEYVIASAADMAHVDGDAVRPQYAIMANHRHDDGANAELLWDTDFGECGQPYLHLKRFVEPGEEITVDYGPRYAYEQHGFARAPAPNPRRLRRLGRNPFREP